jgi:HAD superfamily hydrolase (TIGR01509 family)
VGPDLKLRSPEAVVEFRDRYYSDEKIDKGVLGIVRRLHGRLRLAILSNHPPGLSRWLADWGIDGFFDPVFCSGDEGAVKPDPRVYRAVLGRMGVCATEAVFIDDTVEHVAAARALGMHGIAFTTAAALEADLTALGCL